MPSRMVTRANRLTTAQWASALALVVAILLVALAASRASGSARVEAVLSAVPFTVAAAFGLASRGHAAVASPWWRLLALAFLLLTVATPLRLLSGQDPTEPAVAAALLKLLACVLLLAAISWWSWSQGRAVLLDRVLDAAVTYVALATPYWVLAVRPMVDAGGLDDLRVLDVVGTGAGLLIVAVVAAATTTALVQAWPGTVALLGAGTYCVGALADLGGPGSRPPGLVSLALWASGSALAAGAATLLVRSGGITENRLTALRWQAYPTVVACAVPLGLYLGAAQDGHGAPDAVLLGVALVVLIGCCVVRVVRTVEQAAAQRVVLERLARSDHLTGIPNRRTGDAVLARALARARADGSGVCVAVLDLDHFKTFNDRYGHHAGDELLVGAAHAWAGCLDADQVLARQGGEEFLVVATGHPVGSLVETVDRMRVLTPRGASFSAGVAAWNGQESAADLVARADAALYEAKAAGRARTRVALPGSRSPVGS